MKISLLPFVLCLIIMVSPQIPIAFSQEKITEFENKDYDVKIGYPQSWNIREGDIEPGDFNTQIAIFEPQGDAGLHRSDEYNCADVCIVLYIDNSPRESNLPIETYLDQLINSLKHDLNNFEVIFYDTTNTKLDEHQAYKLIYQEENKDKKYTTVQTGVLYDNQVYIIEYKAMEDYYEQYLPIAEEMIKSLQLPDK